MLKKCPHCGVGVLFTSNLCPSCQKQVADADSLPSAKAEDRVVNSIPADPAATSPVLAGVLLLLAAPCSLGLTTTDPSNPSVFGLGTCFIAVVAAVFSFMQSRAAALRWAWAFDVITAIGALATFIIFGTNIAQNGAPPGSGLMLIEASLIRGGLGFLLGVWALWNLRAAPVLKFIARSPDGSQHECTAAQLHQDFLSGNITEAWTARQEDASEYKPVMQILYPPK